MRTYTLHLPEGAMRGDVRALDRAQAVPDGFSWPAFVFSFLWFFRHRLWIAGLLVLVLIAGLVVLGRLLGLSTGTGFVVALLACWLTGLEASSLRRWTYARDGRPARDAVIAGSSEEAEIKALSRWLDPSASPAAALAARQTAPASSPAPVRHGDDAVIGLFPTSERGR